MRILFLSHNRGNRMDYQHDALLIGMKQLFGSDVVDYPRVDYLYTDFGDISELYGKGFTIPKTIPPDDADRSDIEYKITQKFYEYIICGSIHRNMDLLPLMSRYYPREQVLLIDGEDPQSLLLGLRKVGLYFKRELPEPHDGVFPIHFAMPSTKIGTCGRLMKDRICAHIDPRDRSTYIYDNEHDYYMDYHRSLFAITTSKGGYDCMRHYEILANGCIPWFLDIENCPKTTLTNLPKAELLEALALRNQPPGYWDTNEGHLKWLDLWHRIHLRFMRYSTTEALAQYVLETAAQQRLLKRVEPWLGREVTA